MLGPMTCMILYLHKEGDAHELEHLRDTIFKQLSDLQQTSLLFLRNLRTTNIAFYSEQGTSVRTVQEFSSLLVVATLFLSSWTLIC